MVKKTNPTLAQNASKKKHILIIEDERPLAHALELKFTHEGYETDTCADGAEGLAKAAVGKYDMILLDLIMPNLDGFGFLQSAREKKIKTPIIVLSNLGQEEDRERTKEMGAIDYFVKSNTPITDIVKRVQSAV